MNASPLNPQQIFVLATILRHSSLAAAAAELGVTSSAVSHRLAEIRSRLGDQLIVRAAGRYVLTPRAAHLRPRLEAIVRAAHEAIADDGSADPRALPRTFTVAMRDQFVPTVGAALVSFVTTEAPAASVDVVPYDRERIVEQLATGRVDAAVSVEPPDLSELRRTRLYRESFICASRTDATPKRWTLAAFTERPHLLVTTHPEGIAAVDAALSKLGATRRIVARLPYFLGAMRMVAATNLIATFPERFARSAAASGVALRRPPLDVLGFDVTLLWHERFEDDAARAWLRRALRTCAPG